MAIPKIINYCWFGHHQKPMKVKRCIQSWKKKCPEYRIIEWNEENFDISLCPLFVQNAFRAGKWAFVTDYVRLKIIYEYGGIYLDTDVEIVKCLDPLLTYNAYFGFEDGIYINSGLGFGAIKGCGILKELMSQYDAISFSENAAFLRDITCPKLNTEIFLLHGLAANDQRQILDGGILILPTIYLCPFDYQNRVLRKSEETFSIHWCHGSWITREEKWDNYKTVLKLRLWVPFTDILKEHLGEGYYALRKVWRFLCQ